LGLENLNLGALFVMLSGFLLGVVPAFLIFGFYFGRRSEKEKRAIRLRYERQITALRTTLQRMMEKFDELIGDRNQLKRANEALAEAVRDQHEITDLASQELEDAQNNVARLEQRVDELQADNLRYEGRLEQAEINQQRMAAQTKQVIEQFTQTERLQRNLMFAASQLRESKITYSALEKQLGRKMDPLSSEDDLTSPDKLDIGLIDGLAPEYAQRLHESGVHTIGDLAQQTPARVAHFAGLSDWDDSAAWIAEAKVRLAGSSQARA
jgi:predicted flap endonuclease-1-like 5' DNA nuclease